MNETDVSSAQQFDVGSFLNTIVGVGGALASQKIAASQNTGQPAATTTPNLKAQPGGTAVPATGMSQQTLATIGIVAAVAVGALLLLRK